jgi:hypothetical protein
MGGIHVELEAEAKSSVDVVSGHDQRLASDDDNLIRVQQRRDGADRAV